MDRDIEEVCVEITKKGAFWVCGNFKEHRAAFWKRMNVRTVRDCLRITDVDIQSFAEFDGLAKDMCIEFIDAIKAERGLGAMIVDLDKSEVEQVRAQLMREKRRVQELQTDKEKLEERVDLDKSEVEQLRAQLMREKRRVQELQADKGKLRERVGEIENEWRPLYKKLALACHPDKAASHSQRDTTALFQAVGSFNDTMKTVVDPVHVV